MAGGISKKLFVLVGANTAALKRDLNGASAMVNQFGASVHSSLGGLIGLTAGLVGVGFGVEHLKGVAEAIDKTAKSADRLDMTTEAFTGLQHAAELAGLGAEGFDAAMTTMFKNVGLAAMGQGKAKAALDELGFSSERLAKLSGENQLKAIADAMAEIEDPAKKAAIASRIFGDAGAQMLNVLEGGSATLQEAQKEMDALGGSFSRIDAAQVELANDALTNVATVIKGIEQDLVIALAPIVRQLAEDFLNWSKSGESWRDITLNAVGKVGHGIAMMMDLIDYGKIAWEALKIGGNAALLSMVKPLELFTRALLAPIELSRDVLPKAVVSAAEDVKNTLKALSAELVANMGQSADAIDAIWSGPSRADAFDKWLDDAKTKGAELAAAIADTKPKADPYTRDMFNSVRQSRIEFDDMLSIAEKIRDVNFAPNALVRSGSAQSQAAPFEAAQKSMDAAVNKQIAAQNKANDLLRKIEKNTTPDEEEPFGGGS